MTDDPMTPRTHVMRRVEPAKSGLSVGDFFFETGPDGAEYLIFITPKKIRLPLPISGPRAWTFNGDRERPTVTPSIWNDREGHHDWHGFITNGELLDA